MKCLILSPYPENLKIEGDISVEPLSETPPHEVIVSFGYRHIIPEKIIKEFGKPIINLHTSYFPWNRGYDPNFWSWYEDTPKGVTIHKIDKGIDTGDVLIQKLVTFGEDETLATSYTKLRKEMEQLFNDHWPKLLEYKPKPQPERGTIHYSTQLKKIWHKFPKGWDTPCREVTAMGYKDMNYHV